MSNRCPPDASCDGEPYAGPVVLPLIDGFGRVHRDLRISVTDRCNFRCQYCMPERDYVWLPRADILTFEEIETLVDDILDPDPVRNLGMKLVGRKHGFRFLLKMAWRIGL